MTSFVRLCKIPASAWAELVPFNTVWDIRILLTIRSRQNQVDLVWVQVVQGDICAGRWGLDTAKINRVN